MSKTLVIYFSITGTTKRLAETIASRLGADTYAIQAEEPYSQSDLTWTDDNCRANQEQNNPASRPEFVGHLPDISGYDTIIIGHPIWWGIPPRTVETVVEKLDLTGKRVATFATSGGSTYAQSQTFFNQLLAEQPLPGDVLSSQATLEKWLTALD